MTRIIFATSNQNKLEEVKQLLKLDGINMEISGSDIKFQELQLDSQEEIVKDKLEYAYKSLGLPVFVDDTGIFISKYNNFPGIITKQVVESLGLDGILKLIDEVDKAYFRTIIGFKDGECEEVFEGVLNGTLTKVPFSTINPEAPISSIFIPEGENKTLAELGKDFVNENSHRSRAFAKFLEFLRLKYDK